MKLIIILSFAVLIPLGFLLHKAEQDAVARAERQMAEQEKNEWARYWDGYSKGVEETKDYYVCVEKKL